MRVLKGEVFISWVTDVPVVDRDFVVVSFKVPGAFDVSTPNFLATPLGVIGDFIWGPFVVDCF